MESDLTKSPDYYNLPISIEDAASMFRRKIQKNDRPYIAETTKLNNDKVEDWKTSVLQKVCNDKGDILAGRVLESWKLYEEGKAIEKYIEVKKMGMMLEYPPSVIDFWKDFFEHLSIGEIHSYGTGVVSTGWNIIQSYIRMWFADEKWEKLFSQGDSLYWEQNYKYHSMLLEGKSLPFWNPDIFKEITEKVVTVLSNQIASDSELRN
jgi:hypothetical protein